MFHNYILADFELLNRLDKYAYDKYSKFFYMLYMSSIGPKKKSLDMEMYLKKMKNSKVKFLFMYCPRCNNVDLFCNTDSSYNELKNFKFCGSCGNTHFIIKAQKSNKQIKDFISIERSINRNDSYKLESLRMQAVVMIATQLECFLKDYYASILNLRLSRFRVSSYDRFYADAKNDFLNVGRANKRFKKELLIDLKEVIGLKKFKQLNRLTSYRNVIVHNNGIADKEFISSVDTNFTLNDEIKIEQLELDEFIYAYQKTIVKLTSLYNEEFENVLINNMSTYTDQIIVTSYIINKGLNFVPIMDLIKKNNDA